MVWIQGYEFLIVFWSVSYSRTACSRNSSNVWSRLEHKQHIRWTAFHPVVLVIFLTVYTVPQNDLGYLRCWILFPVPDDQGKHRTAWFSNNLTLFEHLGWLDDFAWQLFYSNSAAIFEALSKRALQWHLVITSYRRQ